MAKKPFLARWRKHVAYIQEKQDLIEQVKRQALSLDSMEAVESLETHTKKSNKQSAGPVRGILPKEEE